MQKRRWGSYKRGSAAAAAAAAADTASSGIGGEAAPPPHKQPEHQATLRSQLAGLRHRAAIRAKKQQSKAASTSQPSSAASSMDEEQQGVRLEYDSSEMSDGCNVASGVTDWAAAEAAHAGAAAKRRFSATESHRRQVMEQMAGLHRRAAASQQVGGLW